MTDSSKCVTSFRGFVTLITGKSSKLAGDRYLFNPQHGMARSSCDFIISSYSMSSLAYLQKSIATQSEQMNGLISDRNWLEQQEFGRRKEEEGSGERGEAVSGVKIRYQRTRRTES